METHARTSKIVGLESGRMLGDGRTMYSGHIDDYCGVEGELYAGAYFTVKRRRVRDGNGRTRGAI
jgi:hypothetical protein